MAAASSPSRATKECLNADFYKKLQKLENLVQRLNYQEKSIATEWMTKLRNANTTLEEMKVRNDFVSYLVKCTDGGVFRTDPFNSVPPPCGSLLVLQNLLPADHKCGCMSLQKQKEFLRNMLQENTEYGAYLAEQPVPRDGVFVVLFMYPL